MKETGSQETQLLGLARYSLGLIFVVLLSLFPPSVLGQDSPITAWVNSSTISTDELVVLTVKVIDDSAQQPRPILPRLDGLAVVDLDISTDVDLVNGQIHTEVIYTYRLQPRRTGLLTIPPVAVKIDGQTFKTPPVSIRVNQGAAPAPSPGNEVLPEDISPPIDLQGDDFFIESVVDLPNPYVGQQIIHTLRFYQAVQIYNEPQYDTPLFNEFETMGLPVQQYNLDAAGRSYLVSEVRTALFPTSTGRVVIGPARLMLPGNIHEEPVDLYTEPIEIEVKPLPDGAPPYFNGAVGQYEIEAWFNPPEATVDQPATLFVAVSGIGNIRDLPELVWPEMTAWQAYNSLTSLTTAMEDNVMTGTRVYERVMVPAEIGEFVIPPISLVYFDPMATEYRTISTESLTTIVVPAQSENPAAQVAPLPTDTPLDIVTADESAETGATGVGVSAWAELWELVRGLATSLSRVLVVGLCGVIPAAIAVGLGGNWLWQRRHSLFAESEPKPEPVSTTASASASEEPLKQPTQSIHPALVAAMKDTGDNYKAVSQALNAYLGDALQTSVNGLTRAELATRLRERGLEQTLIRRIGDSLTQSEMARFGPVTDDVGWSLMVETDDLLFNLDEVFGREA